jgi:hypothetical protein
MTYKERLDRVSAVEQGTFDRPALTVVAGLTYRERSQVFNRWLVPAYQMSIRWTGNRLDAEDATTWVVINEISRLHLPELVQVVDERLTETTLEASGRHCRRGMASPSYGAPQFTQRRRSLSDDRRSASMV